MIKNFRNKFKKKYKHFKNLSLDKMKYRYYIDNLPIDKKSILLESQHGRTFNGNMYYILKELLSNPLYKEYKIYFTVKESNKKQVTKVLQNHGLNFVNTVIIQSNEYYKVLATSKFLFNDTSFLPFFIKRNEQIYINTWHGTPLKTLGKQSNSDAHILGNIQRNFILADYLLYPNEFTMNHMIKDYMIENLSDAKAILGGYPRNSVFFDRNIRSKVREYYEITDDKQIITYMPTYRNYSIPMGKTVENTYTLYHLLELDKQLTDDQILYVNIHPLAGQRINYKLFKHIKPMPKDFETYEFLTATDCLITDYSSVMFDYALTKNKIILFTYDKDEYLKNRGMYIDINSLPFPLVSSIEGLVYEINNNNNNIDYSDLINKYCTYDSIKASENICKTIILDEHNLMPQLNIPKNDKENVLIYAGNLAKNGITASLKNLLLNLDLDERNYYISYIPRKIKHNLTQFEDLKSIVNYIPIQGKMVLNFKEEIIYHLFNKKIISATKMSKYLDYAYKLEIKRLLGYNKFSHVIQFCGYEISPIMKYSKFPCNNVIYVHNNMVEEMNTKGNQRKDVLEYAYAEYDSISIVTTDMINSVNYFNPNANMTVVNNIIDYERVLKLSDEELYFDEDTEINIDYDLFINILNSNAKKYVNIGRFSKEKGQIRLIDAFCRVWNNNKDTYLIIIGGYGSQYKEILEYASNKNCCDHIIIIKFMSNPYALLKKCNYFVLSSFYEGFGIVIAEADMLGLPVISTNVDGPRQFMLENNGHLVDNSVDGIYQGMIDLLNSKIKPMNVNYKEYNNNAINQFKSLLS